MAKTPNDRPDLLPIIGRGGKAFGKTGSISLLTPSENSEGGPQSD